MFESLPLPKTAGHGFSEVSSLTRAACRAQGEGLRHMSLGQADPNIVYTQLVEQHHISTVVDQKKRVRAVSNSNSWSASS